jgi:hypothetical protein
MGVLSLNRPGAFLLRLALAGAAIAITAAACSLAVDLDGLSGGPPDGGTDAQAESCAHAVPPTRPGGSASGGSMVITSAVRSVDLGEASTKEDPVGLDLDRTCTCITDKGSCRSEFSKEDLCDDKNGIDNAGAKLLKSLLAIGAEGAGSVFYTQMAEQGEWGLLLEISEYNGQANDELVTVSLYPSPGMNLIAGSAEGAGGAGGAGGSGGVGGAGGAGGNGALFAEAPGWNGQDAWPITSSALKDGVSINQPIYTDTNAYVANNVLVAQIPELQFRFSGPNSNLSINVRSTTVMGLLEVVGDGLGVRVTKGVMAGYWRIEDVFGGIASLVANGKVLCNDGSLLYNQTKGLLCDFIDIALDPPAEGEVVCNGLSFGMAFETFPAKLGAVVPPEPEPSLCPEGQSPATDTCD